MAELTQVVDEQDRIIGLKERPEINWQTDIYRVSALWLANSQDEVLIAQRKLTKDKDPGRWGPAAAGTLENGETYESNIYKEAEEEIGLSGRVFQLGPKTRIKEPRNYFCQWFTVVADKQLDEFTLQKDEVEELKWLPKEQLVKDIKENPQKYTPAFPTVLKLFCDQKD